MSNQQLIVMLTHGVVRGDARVIKTARSVQNMGYDVRILGRRNNALPKADEPDLRIREVPIPRQHTSPGHLRTMKYPFRYQDSKQQSDTALRLADRSRRSQTRKALSRGFGGLIQNKIRGAGVGLSWRIHGLRQRQLDATVESSIQRTREWLKRSDSQDPRETASQDSYWRSFYPIPLDYDPVFGPILDRMKPNVIHAHDFVILGVAVGAALRAAQEGRRVSVIYDAHEYVAGIDGDERWILGCSALEATYIRLVDQVLTVCPPIALLLKDRYDLADEPPVTLNAPDEQALASDPSFTQDIRSDCGLDQKTPLLVYSGILQKARGIETAVSALVELPGVHLALIANDNQKHRKSLARLANQLGVGDRLHIVDFVPVQHIIQHLRTADVAVGPYTHMGNNEEAMPNKFFDYMQAGVPFVVSDVRWLSKLVTRHGVGEVFEAESASSLASCVRMVLKDLPNYKLRVADAVAQQPWTWADQEPALQKIYGSL